MSFTVTMNSSKNNFNKPKSPQLGLQSSKCTYSIILFLSNFSLYIKENKNKKDIHLA